VDISNENEGITWCSLDAQLIEQGAMTANQTGTWAGERKPWLRKLEPGGTLYSWVMNNHWFTNFPLTQDGPVTFRYRIFPHGPYDAVTANRFGLEQSQPLVALAADKNALDHSLVVLDGAPEVAISVIKSSADGKSMLIRLRSVLDQPCSVSLRWPTQMPSRIHLCEREEIPGPEVEGEIPVPPYGLVTLKAIW
jgi:hypothetical protein